MSASDSFYEKPGEIQERMCGVCGTTCEVDRNVIGPTGWAEAMAKRAHLHDYFYCPHMNKEWHKQALAIIREIEKTPSKRIAALLQQDLVDILFEQGILPKTKEE